MEETFVMLKPDALERRLVGSIISRIEAKGYQILQLKTTRLDADIVREHYSHHIEKDFFPELKNYMLRGQVVLMHIQGPSCIEGMRFLAGPKNPKDAMPGSIRGDYAVDTTENLIHTSDSAEAAAIELSRFRLK